MEDHTVEFIEDEGLYSFTLNVQGSIAYLTQELILQKFIFQNSPSVILKPSTWIFFPTRTFALNAVFFLPTMKKRRKMGKLNDSLVEGCVLCSSGKCPCCGSHLHVDTGSVLDFEQGFRPDCVYFCTSCGYDSGKPPAGITEG